jgi:hypothetical protein
MTIAYWKDIDEHQVPDWGTYLVCDCTEEDSVDLAVWDLDNKWAFEDGSDYANGCLVVTHWAELPEQPPIEERDLQKPELDETCPFVRFKDSPDELDLVTQLLEIGQNLVADAYELDSLQDLVDSALLAMQLLKAVLRHRVTSLRCLCGITSQRIGEDD